MITKNKINFKKGYAVLELLFYLSLFAIISLVVINAMVTMTRSFRETAIQGELAQSSAIMERISREIRGSYDIFSIASNHLKLNTKDEAGTNKIVEFLLSGNDVQLIENNVLVGNLNTPKIVVTGLNFTQLTTTTGKAIKIFFTVRSTSDVLNRTQDFYDTVVLRGSY